MLPSIQIAAFFDELEKVGSLPRYLKDMVRKKDRISSITRWPKDERLAHRLEQWQGGKLNTSIFKHPEKYGRGTPEKLEAYRKSLKTAPKGSRAAAYKKSRESLRGE